MNRTKKTARLLMLGVCANLFLSSGMAYAESEKNEIEKKFQFGLWGDMPYAKNGDQPKMAALFNSINQEKLAFTIYDGDTKDGSSVCSNEVIGVDAVNLLNQVEAPTVYVLGDNEWTDCHRTNNGGYNAIERLNFIRQNVLNTGMSLGQNKMVLTSQGTPGAAYSENTRWTRGGVVFVGLNIPGSNNNKVATGACISAKSARTQADCDADNAEYTDRNAHNLAWLSESFQLAKQSEAAGIMVVIQADPGFDLPETETVNERNLPDIDGYNDFLQMLVDETRAFNGQVVLVHGDTHFFKIDKPMTNQSDMLKNFTRVETFGSPNIHWVKVSVDTKSPNVFHFEPVIVPAN